MDSVSISTSSLFSWTVYSMFILPISLKCLPRSRFLQAALPLLPEYAKSRPDVLGQNTVQTTGSSSLDTKMVTIPVQELSKDQMLLNGPLIPFYTPPTSSHLMPPINPLLSKNLQLVSSFQNTWKICNCQTIVVVLNGCKCNKVTMSIGPNFMQIFSHLGLSKKRVPSKRWLQIATLASRVSHIVFNLQNCLLTII